MNNTIRVIVFLEADKWIAQGLEHDICAQGSTSEEAMKRFESLLKLESREDGGITRIEAAPEHFLKLWDNASESPKDLIAQQFSLAA